MKLSLPSFCRQTAIALLVTASLLAATTGLRAQTVFLTFSGGNGSEVKITWSTPIVYTLDNGTAISAVNPTFVFQSITNSQAIFPISGAAAGGSPTYTSTGAGSTDGTQTINIFAAPPAFNAVANNDVVFYSTNDTANTFLTAGDVITLSAGFLSYTGSPNSSAGYTGALPSNAYYTTFITDGSNTYASNLGSGSAVPEPSTYALITGVALLGFVTCRRQKHAV